MEETKIKIAICGYGNLGKGVEKAIAQNPDMELVGIFSRRKKQDLQTISNVPVFPMEHLEEQEGNIDVVIMCGGSATDLPQQVPVFASCFNTVDSFDTHAKIPEYFAKINEVAQRTNHVSMISVGWDPGMFSLNRVYAEAILPEAKTYTFWGRGVSQGHSDAIRRIQGVKNAIQYTIPVEDAIQSVRSGNNPSLTTGQKHIRECFVVLEEGVDPNKVEQQIITMPNYFAEYHTTVHFLTEEKLKKEHAGMPHGGFVIRTGTTGKDTKQKIEYSLQLESNPEFTASVLVCYARATARLAKKKEYGAKTVLDVPASYVSILSQEELREKLL